MKWNANATEPNANTTKRQHDETNETLRKRLLNANATKRKRRRTRKRQNGVKRNRNGNSTCAFMDLVSFT